LNSEDILIAQELAGYCLLKDYPIHKAFMFVGGGANGKSTLIKLIKTLLGPENCASVALQHLEMDKFALASLFGKLANLYADLPSRALQQTSIFKMLVGEDLIPGEQKFKNKFFFTNYSKQIFSCNQVPKSPDDSDAFFRRWIILVFPNKFLNEKADKKLMQKLTTSTELSGFLNYAIAGYKRLLIQNDFSYSQSVENVREAYIRMSDSVGAFIMDCVEISPDSYEPKKNLYVLYADYCRAKKYPITPENTFHRELQKGVRVEDYRKREGAERIQCWRGIKLSLIDTINPDLIDPPDQNTQVNPKMVKVGGVVNGKSIYNVPNNCVSCGSSNIKIFPNGRVHCRDCHYNSKKEEVTPEQLEEITIKEQPKCQKCGSDAVHLLGKTRYCDSCYKELLK